MKKTPVVRIIICLAVYLGLFLLGASSGAIHPVCFVGAGTVLAIRLAEKAMKKTAEELE